MSDLRPQVIKGCCWRGRGYYGDEGCLCSRVSPGDEEEEMMGPEGRGEGGGEEERVIHILSTVL